MKRGGCSTVRGEGRLKVPGSPVVPPAKATGFMLRLLALHVASSAAGVRRSRHCCWKEPSPSLPQHFGTIVQPAGLYFLAREILAPP